MQTAAEASGDTAAAGMEPLHKSRLIGEIIVTAQKREENVMDVPLSVQAFSEELLDARGIRDQEGLQMVTPGLSVNSTITYATFFLRGIGTSAFLTGDPSVANYVDGIYFPIASGMIQEFGAVKRVEVLKGPQGTLFGRNAVGGAIVTTTKEPDLSEFEGSVQLSGGNFEDGQVRVYSSIPLVKDRFALSASLVYKQRESYYRESTTGGESLPRDLSRAARVKLAWAPTDDLQVMITGFRLAYQGTSPYALNRDPTDIGRALLIEPQTGFSGATSYPVISRTDNRVVYGSITYQAPWFDTKLLASHQDVKTYEAATDLDGSPVAIAYFESDEKADGLASRVRTGELQLLSNDESWGADWLKWIGGVYLFENQTGIDGALGIADVDLARQTIAGIQLPGNIFDVLAGGLAPILALPTGQINVHAGLLTNSKAVFTQATISFTDRIALTLGARYQVEKRDLGPSSVGVQQAGGIETDVIRWQNARDQNGNPRSFHSKHTSLKPKVSLELHPFADDLLVYLSYQEAVKSGTYNPLGFTGPPQYVYPEETTAYEAGLKTHLFDGSAQIETAVFWYDSKNLQTQFLALTTGGLLAFENAGAARVKGVEFLLTSELFPEQIHGLVLSLGGTYLHARYTDYDNARGLVEVAGVCCIATNDNDYAGNRSQRAPTFTGIVSLSKTWNLGPGALEATADGYHNSGFFYEPQNSDVSKQDAYQVYGARLSYLYDPWRVRLTLFGQNLLDERYSAANLRLEFGNLLTLAPPRAYGLRLNWDF